MIYTATIVVSESEAGTLAAAAAADPALAGLAVDASEVGAGRWQVVVYFAGEPDAAQRAALGRIAAFDVAELPETDWVAKSLAGLTPVRAGRFLVHGRHDRGAVRANDIAIEIDAAQAFGTGHHGTTRGCLLAIEAVARSRRIRRALDIGTGSGVLAIAIARLTKARALATDIDPIAVGVARDNIRLNAVAPRVCTVAATGIGGLAFDRFTPADLIVANILAAPLAAMAPAVSRSLAPGGVAILSGLLPDQQRRIVATCRSVGLKFLGARLVDGWLTVTMERP